MCQYLTMEKQLNYIYIHALDHHMALNLVSLFLLHFY